MITPIAVLAPSGRMYYRHPSGMGSVMIFRDTIWRKVLILDAKYRSQQKFGAFELDFPSNGGVPSIDIFQNFVYFNLPDRKFNENYPRDSKTSKENCSLWMKINHIEDSRGNIGVPAVAYCRSILVDGVPCDLPNIQILMRIYSDYETIDSMDPTFDQYLDYSLGPIYIKSQFLNIGPGCFDWGLNRACFWSSSVWRDNNSGSWGINSAGSVGFGTKTAIFSVIPILEL